MEKQTVLIRETINQGVITHVGRSIVITPRTHNKSGDGIKWYPDTYKSERK